MTRFGSILVSVLVIVLGAPAVAQQPPQPTARTLDAVCPRPLEPAGFADTAGNVHEEAIDCLAFYSVTAGASETTYGPAGLVRRDQMASFLARFLELVFGIELPADPEHRFGDVAAGSPHALRINQLAELGVVGGLADGTYGAAQPVRRDQMAAFLNRAHEQVTNELQASDDAFFADVGGNPHEAHVNGLAANGVVTGFGDGTYRPADPVRRDQMASFVMRQADAIAVRAVTSIYRARMLGELAVDEGDFGHGEPDAWGEGVFQLNSRTGRLCYQFLVLATGPFTSAEIRRAPMGENGPVHLTLDLPDAETGRANTCTFVNAEALTAIEQDPTAFSFTVSTTNFPDGALRGQLATRVLNTYLSWAFEVDDRGAEPVFARGETHEDGRAYVQIDPLHGEICAYLVVDTAAEAPDLTVRQARMHENGPAVIDLNPLEEGRSSTCEDAPAGLVADPTGFYLSVDGRMRGQLGAFALAVPLTSDGVPNGQQGASGTFFVQYELRRVACYVLVTDATPPHERVELRRGPDEVTAFEALPGACEEITPEVLAALDAERAEHHLLLRTGAHPEGALAGAVAAGNPW